MTGTKSSFCIPFLTFNDQVHSSPSQISEILANKYEAASFNQSYDPNFLIHKTNAEKNHIDFSTSSCDLPYIQNITEEEIKFTIHNCFKNSSPGVYSNYPCNVETPPPNTLLQQNIPLRLLPNNVENSNSPRYIETQF